jgi:integrase
VLPCVDRLNVPNLPAAPRHSLATTSKIAHSDDRDQSFQRIATSVTRVRDGAVSHGRVHDIRLSGEAVSLVVRERMAAAGFDPAPYSGHSLRSGLATSAAQCGVSSWKIRQQTRHASDAMLARYIRDGNLFQDNAAGALL